MIFLGQYMCIYTNKEMAGKFIEAATSHQSWRGVLFGRERGPIPFGRLSPFF